MARINRLSILAVLTTLSAAVLSACRTFTPPAQYEEIEDNKPYWFHYDATRRGGVALPKGSDIKVIAEPAPDAALAVTAELVASLKTEKADANLQAKLAESIVELGQVTESVKFLRESLYRLAEAANNGNVKAAAYAASFDKVVAVSAEIAKAQKAKAMADAFQALKELKLKDDSVDINSAMESMGIPHPEAAAQGH